MEWYSAPPSVSSSLLKPDVDERGVITDDS